VPYDIKAASNAAKLGQVFVDANRSSKATAAIRQIAERVMGVSTDDMREPSGGEKKSLLGNFDFKSMLAKKPKVDLSKAD
jgi:pilus assembly protein CpaE